MRDAMRQGRDRLAFPHRRTAQPLPLRDRRKCSASASAAPTPCAASPEGQAGQDSLRIWRSRLRASRVIPRGWRSRRRGCELPDDVGHLAGVDGLAQPPDMDVDGALVDIDRLAPNIVEQLAARRPAGCRIMNSSSRNSRRSEADLALLAVDAVLLAVEHDVADLGTEDSTSGQRAGTAP